MEVESMCSISVWRIAMKKSQIDINCVYNIWLDKQVCNAIISIAVGLWPLQARWIRSLNARSTKTTKHADYSSSHCNQQLCMSSYPVSPLFHIYWIINTHGKWLWATMRDWWIFVVPSNIYLYNIIICITTCVVANANATRCRTVCPHQLQCNPQRRLQCNHLSSRGLCLVFIVLCLSTPCGEAEACAWWMQGNNSVGVQSVHLVNL